MRRMDQYLATIDTIYPDVYARESQFQATGDMLAPVPLDYAHSGSFFGRLFARFAVWVEMRRGRAVLRELSDDMLRDIGVTPDAARREVEKSRFLW